MLLWLLLLLTQFWSAIPHTAPVLLEGNWQSCGDNERAFDYCVNGRCQWTLHMGPYDQFALYQYPGPEGEHDHNTTKNLLYPDVYASDYTTRRGLIQKTVPALGITVDIRQAGGNDCESFYVKVEHANTRD